MVITQTLFEIALLSREDVESIRREVEEALESEGGWNKGALDKFYKLDSALREIGRNPGLMHCPLLNALFSLITSDRFYQWYWAASPWLVANWRMGSMFPQDVVSPLT